MEEFICKYCGKICKNKNSLVQHEIRCKLNPNHITVISNFIKYNKSNKNHNNQYIKAKRLGLPKPEISEETRYKMGLGMKGKHLSDEVKHQISESRKKYLDEHPLNSSWLANHSSKPSYGEQYFMGIFEKENIPLKYHKQVSRYELDFYNENLMKYVEIDGEQHYTEKGIEHDNERTQFLKEKGWEGIRIRWSEYKSLSYDEKHNIIEEIKNFIK